jgi:hypothetical protein
MPMGRGPVATVDHREKQALERTGRPPTAFHPPSMRNRWFRVGTGRSHACEAAPGAESPAREGGGHPHASA